MTTSEKPHQPARNYADRELLALAKQLQSGGAIPVPRTRPLTDADFDRLCEIGHRA